MNTHQKSFLFFAKYILIATLVVFIIFISSYSISSSIIPLHSSNNRQILETYLESTVHSYTPNQDSLPDLSNIGGPDSIQVHDFDRISHTSRDGWKRGEHVLILTPLRDAEKHVIRYLDMITNLTYPHNLIDLAFLVSDTKDNTIQILHDKLKLIQTTYPKHLHFRNVTILLKDFGATISQTFSDRHSFRAQGPRRKLMARARNYLLTAALKPDHQWVLWRDADIVSAPNTLIEDLMSHDKDVIVPNCWRPLPIWIDSSGEQPYDLNAWQESNESLRLAESLTDEEEVIVEGYAEYPTYRPHLAYLRETDGSPQNEMDLDGIGGVVILVKSHVHRSGVNFPAFTYKHHVETEGFGKLARKMGYSVSGLPNYVVWHTFEPSQNDIDRMQFVDEETREQMKAEIERAAKGPLRRTETHG